MILNCNYEIILKCNYEIILKCKYEIILKCKFEIILKCKYEIVLKCTRSPRANATWPAVNLRPLEILITFFGEDTVLNGVEKYSKDQ